MSVEEQFYFVWPWVMLFTSRKFLLHVILLLIVIGIVSQIATAPLDDFSGVLTSNCFESLGIGTLLAWITIIRPEKLPALYKILCLAAAVSLVVFIAQVNFPTFNYIKSRVLISLITTWVITFFLIRKDEKPYLLAFLLENKTLMRIGKISYGIYLYHFIIPYYTYHTYLSINNHLHLNPSLIVGKYLWIAENLGILLLLSALSYRYFEVPILSLKTYFKTPNTAATTLTAESNLKAGIIRSN